QMRDMPPSGALAELWEERRLLSEQLVGPTAVPDAPFKHTWPELVMKRMLRWAAEHNYDRLAWTTGAQQNERYRLSKHITRLQVDYDGSSYRVIAYPKASF